MGGVFIENSKNYAIFPLNMLDDERYKNFQVNDFFLYMLLLNRTNISKMNLKHFSDEKGVFVYYSNKQITKDVRCSHSTATKALMNLEKAGLIRKEYQKRGLPLKIYVNDIRIGDCPIDSNCPEKPQDVFSHKLYSNSFYNEKPFTDHFEKNEWQGSADVDKELTQMQINRRTFGSVKNKRHSPKLDSNSVSEEMSVSFDAELEDKLAKAGLVRFSQKKEKRRTRNNGPTL